MDVIHTDGYSDSLGTQALISPTNHYGTLIPLGDIDFYPNWGHTQPGTSSSLNIIASHLRSIDLFIASIQNPRKFITTAKLVEIPSYMEPAKTIQEEEQVAEMGFHCKQNGPRGNYYLKTIASHPFYHTENQLKPQIHFQLEEIHLDSNQTKEPK